MTQADAELELQHRGIKNFMIWPNNALYLGNSAREGARYEIGLNENNDNSIKSLYIANKQ